MSPAAPPPDPIERKEMHRNGAFPSVDLQIAALAAEEWSIVSTDDLHRCRLGRGGIALRVRNGRLHRVHHGVFKVGDARLPVESRFMAAVKACRPEAYLSHRSAAVLWGILDGTDHIPEVTVPGEIRRTHRGIRVRRSWFLVWPDVTRHRGIPVTAPARTLVDLAAVLPADALRRAVRHAPALRLVHLDAIVATQARLGPRPGSRALAAILATGPAPTRSELEDVVLDLILRGGLAHPAVNVPLHAGGRRVVPDFRWPEQRLIVEADGARWHDGALARADDAGRQALLEAHGERVVRVTWTQAVARPRQTLDRLRAAGAPGA